MTRMTNTEIRKAKVGDPLTPGKLAFKVLKVILDTHIKLTPEMAPLLPQEAWEEVEYRLTRLKIRIDEFLAARETS